MRTKMINFSGPGLFTLLVFLLSATGEPIQNGQTLFKLRIEQANGKHYLVWSPLAEDIKKIKVFIVLYQSENDIRPNQLHGTPARFSNCPDIVLRYPGQEFCTSLEQLSHGTLYHLSVRYLLKNDQWGPDGGQVAYRIRSHPNRTAGRLYNRIKLDPPAAPQRSPPELTPPRLPPAAERPPPPLPPPQLPPAPQRAPPPPTRLPPKASPTRATQPQPRRPENPDPLKELCEGSTENLRAVRALTGGGDFLTWEIPLANRDHVGDFRIYWQFEGARWWREITGPKDSFKCPLGLNLPGYCFSLKSLPSDKQSFTLKIAPQLSSGHKCSPTGEIAYYRQASGSLQPNVQPVPQPQYPMIIDQPEPYLQQSGPQYPGIITQPGLQPYGPLPQDPSPGVGSEPVPQPGGPVPQVPYQQNFGPVGQPVQSQGPMPPLQGHQYKHHTGEGSFDDQPLLVDLYENFDCERFCNPIIAPLFFGGKLLTPCFTRCGHYIVDSCLRFCIAPFSYKPGLCKRICVTGQECDNCGDECGEGTECEPDCSEGTKCETDFSTNEDIVPAMDGLRQGLSPMLTRSLLGQYGDIGMGPTFGDDTLASQLYNNYGIGGGSSLSSEDAYQRLLLQGLSRRSRGSRLGDLAVLSSQLGMNLARDQPKLCERNCNPAPAAIIKPPGAPAAIKMPPGKVHYGDYGGDGLGSNLGSSLMQIMRLKLSMSLHRIKMKMYLKLMDVFKETVGAGDRQCCTPTDGSDGPCTGTNGPCDPSTNPVPEIGSHRYQKGFHCWQVRYKEMALVCFWEKSTTCKSYKVILEQITPYRSKEDRLEQVAPKECDFEKFGIGLADLNNTHSCVTINATESPFKPRDSVSDESINRNLTASLWCSAQESGSDYKWIAEYKLTENVNVFPGTLSQTNRKANFKAVESLPLPLNSWISLADKSQPFHRRTINSGAIQLEASHCLILKYKISDRSAKVLAELCPETDLKNCSRQVLRYRGKYAVDQEQCTTWGRILESGSYVVKFTLKHTRFELTNDPKVSVKLEGSNECDSCKK